MSPAERRRRLLAVLGLLPLGAGCDRKPSAVEDVPQPSCFTEYGCLPAAQEPPAKPAAAPYDRCAAHVEPPADGGLTLDKPVYGARNAMPPDRAQVTRRVEFSAERTRAVRDERNVNHMPNACCYEWQGGCMGGRPYRVEGRLRLARLVRVSDETFRNEVRCEGSYPAVALHWRHAGLFEHASIASFERFARQLDRLGAPARLVADARAAARDEAEHARLCFSLAWRLDGEALGTGELAPDTAQPVTLNELTRETFFDGCVEETVAAALADHAAQLASDPAAKAALLRIARDEQRHAELAFRALAWAVSRGAAPELRECVRRLERAASAACEVPAGDPDEHVAFGKTSDRTRRAIWNAVVEAVVLPCARALAAHCEARPSRVTL